MESEERKNWWCIVTYIGSTPYYYCGYYDAYSHEPSVLKPAISNDFNEALKISTKQDALKILSRMKLPSWKVEEHAYFYSS